MDPVKLDIYIWDSARLQGQVLVTKNREDPQGPRHQTSTIKTAQNEKLNKPFPCFDCLILCLVTYCPMGWWISFLFNQSVFDTHMTTDLSNVSLRFCSCACQLLCSLTPVCLCASLQRHVSTLNSGSSGRQTGEREGDGSMGGKGIFH